MNKKLAKIKSIRLFLLQQISHLTTAQLNAVPAGFNNNIIWNLGHLLASEQAICYRRAGLTITTDDQYFTPFLTNTKPDNFIDSAEIEVIKGLLISTIGTLQNDLDNQLFDQYTKSENIERAYGISLLNIDDALDFLLYHEGLHSGVIIGLKRLV